MKLKDIADLAGVSVSTVSRVINSQNTKCASREVQDRIWEAVRYLGYTPNPYAQNLKRKDIENSHSFHDSIAYAYSSGRNKDYHDWELLYLIEQEIMSHHYSARPLDPNASEIPGERRESGIILIGNSFGYPLSHYQSLYKNVVCIAEAHVDFACDLILMDRKKAILSAYDYLCSLGHQHIAFVGKKDALLNIKSKGKKLHNSMEAISCGSAISDGFSLGLELSRNPLKLSALICESSTAACGITQAFCESGISIPEDISVVCLDSGKRISSSSISIPISSFSYNKYDISRTAADLLIDRISHRHNIPVTYSPECIFEDNKSCSICRSKE